MIASSGEDFGRQPEMELVPLLKKKKKKLAHPLPQVQIQQRVNSLQPGRGFSPEQNCPTLDIGLEGHEEGVP